MRRIRVALTVCGCLCLWLTALPAGLRAQVATDRHPVPQEHPRLFGSRERLRSLAAERPEEYARMKAVLAWPEVDDHALMFSLALVCAVEPDSALGRRAVELALKYVNGPIQIGHVTFGHDLANCAVIYDMCWEYWTDQERQAFHTYVNATVDGNVDQETTPFANGWYGYKHWGYGLACYASYYENPRAPAILSKLESDYRNLAVPALELAGEGGGWAEGYYINYWNYEWMVFCEAAMFCEGQDYCEMAPKFFRERAVASMFEAYPWISDYHSRRPIPMGDSGGRLYGGDRDKTLNVRRILASRYRNDPSHQAVHTFNETTPRASGGTNAYKDFLWHDTSVPGASLETYKLSHYSSGPGYVYARSSWRDDATYFFFKCGDRFTSHQHLEVGHFMIARREELLGDGGHYYEFGGFHDVNYSLRTIAHNTMLVYNSAEAIRADIRAGDVTGNDGGQNYPWAHHNGLAAQVSDWKANKGQFDIADMLAYRDHGDWLYTAGDCSRAYDKGKLDYFYRQIVYIRPGRFVVFDRVKSPRSSYKKTFLLQAMKVPQLDGQRIRIDNGGGRLFALTVLPERAVIRLNSGADLYTYNGHSYPPTTDTGPAPECRVEISPFSSSNEDLFLHVFEACDNTQGAMCEVTRLGDGTGEAGVRLAAGPGGPAVEVLFSRSGTVGARIRVGDSGEYIDLPAGIDTSVPVIPLRGDIDGDGRRSLKDALELILRALRDPTDSSLDLNADGTATWADALELLRLIRSAEE